jgi:ATP-dependent Lhr-like helicase
LEARGEIRGGRFVAGFSGEQFALPDAIGLLREVRRDKEAEDWVSISAADPLNLVGVLTPGLKLPSLAANRLLYRNGLPVASLAAGEVHFYEALEPGAEWRARKLLLQTAGPGALAETG